MPGKHICLTVLGRNRPGIIAGIAGTLFERECNIRDSVMTILGSEFSLMMMIDLPEGMTAEELLSTLHLMDHRYSLKFQCRELVDEDMVIESPPGTKNWAITIYGGDRRGILHHVATVLARKNINITEMKTRVLGLIDGAGIAWIKVAAPAEVDLENLRVELNEAAIRFGVEVSIG